MKQPVRANFSGLEALCPAIKDAYAFTQTPARRYDGPGAAAPSYTPVARTDYSVPRKRFIMHRRM